MPDPDLEMGGGGGSSRPLDKGGGRSPKNFFSVWSKNKGGAPPLDPPLQSHNENSNCNIALTRVPERKKSMTSWRHTVERERKEESRDEVKTTAAN